MVIWSSAAAFSLDFVLTGADFDKVAQLFRFELAHH